MVVDDANDDDNVAAAPGVVAGMDIDSNCDKTAPAAGMDDSIASRVRRHRAPRPVLLQTTCTFNPSVVYCTSVLCRPMPHTLMGDAVEPEPMQANLPM
eukprot:6212347-Pleurochrysis_carterae.AAC.2